jgi:V8-like Glu-specific endopeptidase
MCGQVVGTNWDTEFEPGDDTLAHWVHHTYWVDWDGTAATQGGDSGAPVYAGKS